MPPQTAAYKQIILSFVSLGVVAFFGFMLTRPSHAEPSEVPSAVDLDSNSVSRKGSEATLIKTAPAKAEIINDALKTSGQVLFSSESSVKISPRVQGRIKEVFVRVGDHVSKGQTLATLESVDASASNNTLHQAENRLRLAKTVRLRQERLFKLGTPDVTSAQANLDQAIANTEFKKEALQRLQEQAGIGGFTQKPLEDAQTLLLGANADFAQAQADLALAEKDFARKTKLVEIGVAAKADLEASENQVQKLKLTIEANRQKADLAKQAADREKKAYRSNLYANQQVRSAQSDFRQAELQEQTSKRSLTLAKASILKDIEQAKSDELSAQVDTDSAKRALQLLGNPDINGNLRLLSPISGVVTDRQVSPGQVVDQSQMTPWQMFTISDVSTVIVESDIYEKNIAAVKRGVPVKIKIAAYPDRIFSGEISRVSPTLDAKSHTVKVRTQVDNRSGLLKDGMYAEAEIKSNHTRKSVSVPLSAVQHDGDSDFVFVEERHRYLRRKVILGEQRSGNAIIASGLNPGDRVVIQGAIFLNSQLSGG